MHQTLTVAFCALLAFPQPPPDPSLEIPTEAKVYVPVPVKLKDAFATTKVKWKVVPEPAWSEKLNPTEGIGFRFTGPPGTYRLRVDYVDFKKELWGDASAEVVISGDAPPPGPTPPTPPGPTPVPPTPAPTTPLIQENGFHVLVKFDRDATDRPANERNILFSQSVRDALGDMCPTAIDGGMGYRFYPVPAQGVKDPWKDAYGAVQGELPTATISKDGRKGWAGSIKGWTAEQFIAKCKEIKDAN